jgi:AbrB family looped-hinge helix DNA binding protein
MATSKVGKRGTVVIPAQLRQRFDLHEGALVVIEAQEDGVLIRPAVVVPLDSELRRRWLQETNAAYADLRADPAAWQAELAERAAWDATLMDGLDAQEAWTEDGDVLQPRNPAGG